MSAENKILQAVQNPLEKATELVKNAAERVQVTMQASEEMRNPVGQEYYRLLEERMGAGVRVTRVGFGSPAEFTVLMAKKPHIHSYRPHYSFQRVDDVGYRRMLMVDRSKMIFRVSEQEVLRVYYTESEETIEEYLKYFRAHLERPT